VLLSISSYLQSYQESLIGRLAKKTFNVTENRVSQAWILAIVQCWRLIIRNPTIILITSHVCSFVTAVYVDLLQNNIRTCELFIGTDMDDTKAKEDCNSSYTLMISLVFHLVFD
jgi:hypothetical protein